MPTGSAGSEFIFTVLSVCCFPNGHVKYVPWIEETLRLARDVLSGHFYDDLLEHRLVRPSVIELHRIIAFTLKHPTTTNTKTTHTQGVITMLL